MPRADNGNVKGCRRCHTRRIACDLTEPSCKKCLKKGFECPGYGRDYRWTNAVAVRGYLRGRNVPVRPEQAPEAETVMAEPSRVAYAQPSRGPEFFLEHFIFAIAPLMVWIDSERNEYKRLIPLARRQPVLMLSMQAASAAHLAEDADESDRLCNAAMAMMASMIKPMLDTGDDLALPHEADQERLEALLASMMILSSHSLINAKPTEAQGHRQAARLILNALCQNKYDGQGRARFLKNQLALYEILACTTLTEAGPVQVAPEELFCEYMTLLHSITRLSSDRANGIQTPPFPVPDELEGQFDLALGSALLAASPLLEGRQSSFRRDFVRLANLYHHAGILYAFDRLDLRGTTDIQDTSKRKIFTILESFEDIQAIFQNLPWPTFIAGTVAGQDERKQKLIRDIFRTLSSSTYFHHYLNIIDFLEDLWKDSTISWIDLAARYNLNNCPIIAI